MKICPACNRTYADQTLIFCLDDGSTLSAQYDPRETRLLPVTQTSEPPPTEIFPPQPKTTEVSPPLIPTMQALQPPPRYPEQQQTKLNEKERGKPWVIVGVVIFLVFVFGAGGVLSFIWFGKDRTADPKAPVTKAIPSASPTSTTAAGDWGPRNETGSLNGENLTYYPGTTPEQCQADCTRDKRCKGFTFIRPGAYNPGDPAMCYQASVVSGMVSHPCCISAVKQ
ncbi:MAG: hypothetical protein JWM21_3436 [Acidobacteria bacterium]|nr:hypothetical protein [Acidobacteriota bacterium]